MIRKIHLEDLEFLMYKKPCMSCGKKFQVRVRVKDGKILDNAGYFGILRRGVGNWSQSKAKTDEKGKLVHDKDGLIVWEKCHPFWKETWYHLIDFKRTMLHQYIDVEMWECPKCMMKVKRKFQKKSSAKSSQI